MKPSTITALLLPCVLSLSLPRQSHKTVRWMPLGDSITDYGCWRAWIYLRLQNDPDLYDSVDLVGGERAGEICDDSEFDRDHEGHPGFPAIQMANEGRVSEWLAMNPADVVTMHLGTVDIVRGKPRTEELLRAYSTLVGQMRGRNPNMRIIVSTVGILAGQEHALLTREIGGADYPAWAERGKERAGQRAEQSDSCLGGQPKHHVESDLGRRLVHWFRCRGGFV